MTPIVLRYAEDRTGKNPNNLVSGEPHKTTNRRVRAIAPLYGPFYSKSLVVRNAVTKQPLNKEDYVAVEFYESISNLTGHEVCAIVLITNETITAQEFELDYQCVGGEFSYSYDAIARMLDKINADDRPIKWGDIINLPPQFVPSPHLHDIGDTYGWEYVVAELELIRKAILMGDSASHDAIYAYIDRLIAEVSDGQGDFDLRLKNHIENLNNPHQTTKSHVGLGNVQNYPVATKAQAEAGTDNASYMTPLRTKEAIAKQAGDLINAHVNDKNNPHGVTKTQVGLGSVQNYPIATQEQAEVGAHTASYMTPQRTKQAIDKQVRVAFDAHTADKNNPHGVTKAQVGLGNVQNYAVATKAQAEAGIDNTSYMTPLRVKEAISALGGGDIAAHINDKNNPHAVTKTQVGLGDVQNYPIATKVQAETGADNASYMTPLRTKEAIDKQVRTALNTHVADKNNPHGVTTEQIGAVSKAELTTSLGGYIKKEKDKFEGNVTSASNAQSRELVESHVVMGNSANADGSGPYPAYAGHFYNFHNKQTNKKTSFSLANINHQMQFRLIDGSFTSPTLWSLNENGDLFVKGDIEGFSDPRLKENLRAIPEPLSKLKALKGVYFNWRDIPDVTADKAGKLDLGVSADDVERILPEALGSYTAEDGTVYKTVKYKLLIPLLIEAVKTLSDEVEILKHRA